MNAHLYHHHSTTNFISSIFKSCNDLKTLKQIHASLIISNGIKDDETATEIAPNLVSLYAKFGGCNNLFAVLKSMKRSDALLWNLSIKARVISGDVESAFQLYKEMRVMGVEHDSYTFPIINQAVLRSPESFWFGKIIHCLAFRMGLVSDVYFCNTMIEAYVKDQSFEDARKLFEEMPYRDIVSWSSTISGYVREGNVTGAFIWFRKMLNEAVPKPNAVTMLSMLQVCPGAPEVGQLHSYLIKTGWLHDQSVGNSLLKTYIDLGCVADAEFLLGETDRRRDIISWNIMFSLYSGRGEIVEMNRCFREMQGSEVEPSSVTLTMFLSGLLVAVAVVKGGNHLCQGKQIHCLVMKKGLFDDKLRTCLIDFYAKCGGMDMSTLLFEEICYPNHITWNALISGFLENGQFKEAIFLFKQMPAAGFFPAIENLSTLLVAYTCAGAIQLGKGVHGYATRNLFLDSVDGNRRTILELETSILNMYVRCGSISAARNCFDRMATKDIVAWTSMIEGYGIHGLGFEALELFQKMVEEREVEPNGITFLSLLAACSHSGLLHEGCQLLRSMKWHFNLEPDLNHYTCIVDLLGRSGRLKEALALILKLVSFPDSGIWGSLLAASRVHMEKRVGEYAARKLLEMDADNVGCYTLLSNLQASAEMWDEVEAVRRSMKARDLIKNNPGWSCISIETTKGG